MILSIHEIDHTETATLSVVRADGQFVCYALEAGMFQRVPAGLYTVKKDFDSRKAAKMKRRFKHDFAMILCSTTNSEICVHVCIGSGPDECNTENRNLLIGRAAAFCGDHYLQQTGTGYDNFYKLIYNNHHDLKILITRA